MHELTPYRPSGTLANLSQPTSTFVGCLAVPLIIVWWLASIFLFFPSMEALEDSPLLCVGFVAIVALLIGGTVAIYRGVGWLWKKIIRVKIDDPQVLADGQYIRRGEMINITYIQPFKQQTALEGISIKFILREWVKYQSGTDTVTETHEEVFGEHTRPAQIVSEGHKLKEQVQFYVPEAAMHSLNYEHNRLTWLVVVQAKIQTWPDMYDEYELILSPGDH